MTYFYTFASVLAGGLTPTMFALFDKSMKNDWLIAAWIAGAQVFKLIGLATARTVVDDVGERAGEIANTGLQRQRLKP